MNLAQIKKSLGQRVQLVPIACRLDSLGRELPHINDTWLISEVAEEGVRIENPRTGHFTVLGKDHIHHFTTNPDASRVAGVPHGFLTLLVQLYLQGPKLWITPTPRPGESVPPPPARITEKVVDFGYPKDSGLQARLAAQGYQLAWCFEPRLTRKTELEGWEVVAEADASGQHTTYRLRDRPADQILVMKAL
jgi:hypothetical protein